MSLYTETIRPLLFRLDPERMHDLSIRATEIAGTSPLITSILRRTCTFDDPRLRTNVAGIEFKNPIGLAAGYDKNARGVTALSAMGFGHVEIGSVSAFPSAGNAKPRLFRLPEDQGIIVHYGLPNEGADVIATRLRSSAADVPVGVNIVKTNDPNRPATEEEVFSDYARSFDMLHDFGAYVCLNLSCPNTPDGREFFAASRIDELLTRISPAAAIASKPVFLKIKPSTDAGFWRDVIAVAERYPFIAGFEINLPPGKPDGLRVTCDPAYLQRCPGSVSGKPTEAIINASLSSLHRSLGPTSRFKLIIAGGVFDAADAYRKIRLGASLVQIYTGLIYRGPLVVREILEGMLRLLDRDRFETVSHAVGADA